MTKTTNKLLKGCAVAFLACTTVGGAFALASNVEAQASGSMNFAMQEGAYIRTPDAGSNVYGIRFVADMGAGLYAADSTYHMMIMPAPWVARYSLTPTSDIYDVLVNTEGKVVGESLIVLNVKPTQNGANYQLKGSVTTIDYENTFRDFFAVAYAEDAAGERTYATFETDAEQRAEKNERSISEVASLALNEGTYSDPVKTELKNTVKAAYNAHKGNAESAQVELPTPSITAQAATYVETGSEIPAFTIPTEIAEMQQNIGLAAEWISSHPDVATVDATGKIDIVGDKGAANIHLRALGENTLAATYNVSMYGKTETFDADKTTISGATFAGNYLSGSKSGELTFTDTDGALVASGATTATGGVAFFAFPDGGMEAGYAYTAEFDLTTSATTVQFAVRNANQQQATGWHSVGGETSFNTLTLASCAQVEGNHYTLFFVAEEDINGAFLAFRNFVDNPLTFDNFKFTKTVYDGTDKLDCAVMKNATTLLGEKYTVLRQDTTNVTTFALTTDGLPTNGSGNALGVSFGQTTAGIGIDLPMEVGKSYQIEFDIDVSKGAAQWAIRDTWNVWKVENVTQSSFANITSGHFSQTFTPTYALSTGRFVIRAANVATDFVIDNVKITVTTAS